MKQKVETSGIIKLSLNEVHETTIHHIRRHIHRELKHVSIQGEVVIRTCANGSLTFIKHHDIEQKVEDPLDE